MDPPAPKISSQTVICPTNSSWIGSTSTSTKSTTPTQQRHQPPRSMTQHDAPSVLGTGPPAHHADAYPNYNSSSDSSVSSPATSEEDTNNAILLPHNLSPRLVANSNRDGPDFKQQACSFIVPGEIVEGEIVDQELKGGSRSSGKERIATPVSNKKHSHTSSNHHRYNPRASDVTRKRTNKSIVAKQDTPEPALLPPPDIVSSAPEPKSQLRWEFDTGPTKSECGCCVS